MLQSKVKYELLLLRIVMWQIIIAEDIEALLRNLSSP
jgi:hypothetical protein